MKTLKVGRAHPDWKCDFECKGCGTVHEIERADLFLAHTHDISGPRDQVLATCIACNETIVVENHASTNWGDLPRQVRCKSCRQTSIIAAADFNDPHCAHCNEVVQLPKPQEQGYLGYR